MLAALLPALLLAFPAALAGSATLDTQNVTYDLRIDGRSVGRRTVTIRFVPPDDLVDYESRVIESYQDLQAPIAGRVVRHVSRVAARASEGRSSFVASVDQDGTVREIQGRLFEDGHWSVIELSKGTQKTWEYRRTEVDLSSMDLLDPTRHALFTDNARAQVLVAETGQVVSGVVTNEGEATIDIGGRPVAVQQWSLTPEAGGRLDLAWTLDGVLVSYEIDFLGKTLQANATAAPEPRVFEQVQDVETSFLGTSAVSEEEL